MVSGFQAGTAEWGDEKVPAFVILTRSTMQETTIKHPAPHLTRPTSTDVKGDGIDMLGRVRCIPGPGSFMSPSRR